MLFRFRRINHILHDLHPPTLALPFWQCHELAQAAVDSIWLKAKLPHEPKETPIVHTTFSQPCAYLRTAVLAIACRPGEEVPECKSCLLLEISNYHAGFGLANGCFRYFFFACFDQRWYDASQA